MGKHAPASIPSIGKDEGFMTAPQNSDRDSNDSRAAAVAAALANIAPIATAHSFTISSHKQQPKAATSDCHLKLQHRRIKCLTPSSALLSLPLDGCTTRT